MPLPFNVGELALLGFLKCFCDPFEILLNPLHVLLVPGAIFVCSLSDGAAKKFSGNNEEYD